MSPEITLVYDVDCPNVPEARAVLREALRKSGLEPDWREWIRDDPTTPERFRGYGSPTILVGGIDVDGAGAGTSAAACRIYVGPDRCFCGVPPVDRVVQAIGSATAELAPGEPCERADLTRTRSAWAFWGLPVVGILVASTLDDGPRAVVWAASFGSMGVACVANALRCRRLHCYVTGPLLLVAAIASAARGFGAPIPWAWIGVGALCAAALAYVLERIHGKYAVTERRSA